MKFSNALTTGAAAGTGYAVGAHSNWVDVLQGIVMAVGLIVLWLCFMHEPRPKKPGTKRDGLGRS